MWDGSSFPFFSKLLWTQCWGQNWVFDIQVTSFLPLHKKIKIHIRSGIMSISCLMLINREFEIQKGLKTWLVGDPGGGPRSHGEAASRLWRCLGGLRQPGSPEGREGLKNRETSLAEAQEHSLLPALSVFLLQFSPFLLDFLLLILYHKSDNPIYPFFLLCPHA